MAMSIQLTCKFCLFYGRKSFARLAEYRAAIQLIMGNIVQEQQQSKRENLGNYRCVPKSIYACRIPK